MATSSPKLFSAERARTDMGPIAHDQPRILQYIDSTARPEGDRIRKTMNRLFDMYPHCDRERLRAALNGDRGNFEGAVFELYMCGLLRAFGFDVEVSPKTPSGLTPDFLARADGCSAGFYVETTVIRDAGADSPFDKAIYQLDAEVAPLITVRGFAVTLRQPESTRGRKNPRPRHFARFLNEWFGRAGEPDQPAERCYTDERTGWSLSLSLMHMRDPNLKPPRVFAAYGSRAGWPDFQGAELIVKEVEKKRHKYRCLDRPLVVAVGMNDWLLEPQAIGIRRALMGEGGVSPGEAVWMDAEGRPRHSPIGLIYVARCWFSALQDAVPELWDNPHADVHFRPWPLKRIEMVGPAYDIVTHEGADAARLLGIAD